MVWAAFGFNDQVDLAFLDGRQNSPKYKETLESHLMPFAENIGGRNWEYQHDNAPTHTSSATKNYLNSKNVTILEGPPMSPDPNPIENVVGHYVSEDYRIYAGLEEVSHLRNWRIADSKQGSKEDKLCMQINYKSKVRLQTMDIGIV
ncbi:hypothetical protein AVEN_250457-1 [Araneus ventricosus]|uniref:Tc1-like transposase DDE domain-containing protein n=1 Tax=Araneus ventricosus TaxID=182803 RepID=A0A4Y2T8U3_ARAVE|nr:hypothetical protein AVEN_250457-1 [Araneus ventricosus]